CSSYKIWFQWSMTKLCSLPTPPSCGLEGDDFPEIVQFVYPLLEAQLLLCPAFPGALIHGSKHQVIVANNFWLILAKKGGKEMFQIILVSDEQITVVTVAARLVQRDQVHRVHMDQQWQLPLAHFVTALRATRKPHVLVWIEKEAVLRGLFAKLRCRFLFPICH